MLRVWPLLLLLPVILKVSSASPAKLYSVQVHNRTLRDLECYEDEYWHKGKCCKTCPAGTHVSAHCTVTHTRGICEACTAGEYFTAGPNGMERCLPCLRCKDDEVLVQECTPISDAKCQCKPGFYCSPDEPCEICNRCSRCGESQWIKQLCTSTTDTVCEDVSAPTSPNANVKSGQTERVPINFIDDQTRHKEVTTDPPDDPAGSKSDVSITLAIVAIVVPLIIGIAIFGYHYWKRKEKDNIKNSLMGTMNSANTSLASVQTQEKDPKEEEVCPERQQLMTAEPRKVENLINQMSVPYVPAAQSEAMENNVAEPPEDNVEYEESLELGKPCKECGYPQPCDRQWDEFFYSVIESVRPADILQLVRKLHLHKSRIEEILKDNSNNCKEQNYKLLSEWRVQKGKQASMIAVLTLLNDMDLGGCCENIVNNLRNKKIPMN